MTVSYDISSYKSMVKMSSRKRVLVEGKDDKCFIKNLIIKLGGSCSSIRIDTAEDVRGDCSRTARCNKAKIEKISANCNKSEAFKNLYYFCDREFHGFEFGEKIIDSIGCHYIDGNMYYTRGHSIENYFFDVNIIIDSFEFICESEYKHEASIVFLKNYKTILQIISAIALSGRGDVNFSFSHGTIRWDNFTFNDSGIIFDIDDWINSFKSSADIHKKFACAYKCNFLAAQSSAQEVCGFVLRGHTGVIMLQRIYAACLCHAAKADGCSDPERSAKKFAAHSDDHLATALSESWARKSAENTVIYPEDFLKNFVAA